MLGELLARDCAFRQAELTCEEPRSRRFLQTHARQEALHAHVFRGAVGWLAPRVLDSKPAVPELARYRALIEQALVRGNFVASALLAQQVILEGLGDVVFDRIDGGMTHRGIGLTKLRRMLNVIDSQPAKIRLARGGTEHEIMVGDQVLARSCGHLPCRHRPSRTCF